MSTQGIDIRQTTGQILFRVSLKDQFGAKITSGTTELRVYRLEDDGTLDVYDWTTNDFVAPGGGTPDDETTMTHQQRRDSTGADVDTGIWTNVLSTLTNWTTGQVYVAQVTNTNASPESQEREFQFGIAAHADLGPTQAQVDRNADLIESQRGHHTWQGNTYYVDPVNGNDSTGDGSRSLPYATIQAAHDDLVTDSNHDVIFLVAGAAAGVTTHTVAATTTISKRYVFIRGPGRDFIVTRTGAGDTIDVTGDGVELSGFQLGTAATGSGDGINVTDADFVCIHDLWVLDTRGDGVHILRGANTRIHDNHFTGTGVSGSGQGVHIVGTAGSSNDTIIHNNHFANTAGDSILIEQGTTNDTEIHHNTIHNAGGWGINIGGSSTDAQVHSNILGNNSSGNINNAGTDSIIKNNEQWSAPVQTTTIATLASQTSFTLSGGSSDDDAYKGLTILVANEADPDQVAHSLISIYTGATKTVTLPVDPGVFTMAVGDKVTISATATAPGVADEVLTGGTHNVTNSLGRRIRELDDLLGYEGGAVWLDTVNGTGGQVVGDNGIVDNPSDNITDTIAIAVAKGLVRIRVASGSTVTLVAALEGYEIFNANWTLVLEGQSISGSCIIGADASGVCTGAIEPSFRSCHFTNVTLPPCHLTRCGFAGTITAGSAGDFFFEMCHSMVAGTSAPIFDFGSGLNASNVSFRHYSGGIEIQNMGAGSGSYNMSLEGFGQIIINANCSPTSTIAIRGMFTVTDNVVGGFVAGGGVISDNARYDVRQVSKGAFARDAAGDVIVATSTTDTGRATNLQAAYDAAKALTPGGNALAANNRARCIVPSGRYDFVTGDGTNHGLVLDTEFVDLIGLTGDPDDVVLTSQIATASRGTLEQTADDVRTNGITVDIDSAYGSQVVDATDPAAYWPNADLSSVVISDCKFTTQDSTNAWSTRLDVEFSGTHTKCVVGTMGFGSPASGTFTGCIGGFQSFGGSTSLVASGTFTDCIGGNESFGGGNGIASGTFIGCIGGDDSFGGGSGTASGVFANCVGGTDSFEVAGSGLFVNCSRDGALLDNSAKQVNATQINSVAAAAIRLGLSAGQLIPGTVDNTVAPTATVFEADDITEATDDHFNGRSIVFTTGALAGQATAITDYELNGANGKFTVVALTEAPSNDDTFVIV